MAVTMEHIKTLRDLTGAGILDCKKALKESDGDLEKAKDYLRKRGEKIALKKAGRDTSEGAIGSYIHSNGKIGVLVELQCETDFVARTDHFKELLADLCLHVAGTPYPPLAVKREEVDPAVVAKERKIFAEQVRQEGKPEHIIDKIVEGKLNKFYQERVLLEQPFVKEPKKTIKQLLQEGIQRVGENLTLARFARFQLGVD